MLNGKWKGPTQEPGVDLRAENAYCGVPFRCFIRAEISGGHRPSLQRLKEAHLIL